MTLYYFDIRLSCFFCENLVCFCLSWKNPNNFLGFLFHDPEKTCNILRALARIFAMIWQEKSEVQKFYSEENQDAKHWGLKLSTSFVKIHFMLVRRKKANTGFHDKNLQNPHLSLISFSAIFKIRKAKSSSQINSCFYPMFAKWARLNEPTLVDHVFENILFSL